MNADPLHEGLGFDSACPPAGLRAQFHVTASISTGGGHTRNLQLPEGGFQVLPRLVVPVLRSCQSAVRMYM